MHTSSKTLWHRLLGKLLEESLTPVGISVCVECPVMSQPPKADVLLLRRDLPDWTDAQQQRLPDGIRDQKARHILIEFKYTESLTVAALQQSLAYDFLYKQSQNLGDAEVQTFLVCAKRTQAERLAQFGYVPTATPGVYQNQHLVLNRIILLSLNELADSPHNAFFKCFASQKVEKQKAFDWLMESPLKLSLTGSVCDFVKGLWNYWFPLRGEEMNLEVTPEHIARLGKRWRRTMLKGFSIEDVLSEFKAEDLLAHLKPAQRLAGLKPEQILAEFKPEQLLARFKPEQILAEFKPEQRVAGLKPEQVLAEFKPEQRMAGLKPEQVLAGFKPEQRLAGLNLEERLAGLEPQELENYLLKLKRKPSVSPAKSRKPSRSRK